MYSYVATVTKRKRLKFANRTNDSVWEKLAQRRKKACIFTLFKAYTAERTWKCIGDRLKWPCYLSRNDHGCKIMACKQNTDIGKYCSVNRTIRLSNQLPAEVIVTFLCKSHIFRKRVRKVIISEKWMVTQFVTVLLDRVSSFTWTGNRVHHITDACHLPLYTRRYCHSSQSASSHNTVNIIYKWCLARHSTLPYDNMAT